MPVPSPSGARIRDLPGFYYDEEKKRYFKIESGATAPSTAAWSAESVKKRKAEKQLATREQKRQERTKDLIKRSRALAHHQTGGRLAREFGVVDPELPVESWAAGLRERGSVSFLPGQMWSDDAPNIPCMIINGDDEASGLGAAYATPDEHHVIGSYIPTDKDDRINFAITDEMRASRLAGLRAEAIHLEEITSMSYHRPSSSVIVTATSPTGPNGSAQGQVCIFHPRPSSGAPGEDEDLLGDRDSQWYYRQEFGGRRPAWLLGGCEHQLVFTCPVRGLAVNSVRPYQASAPGHLDALVATSHGVMRLGGDAGGEDMRWVTPEPGGGDGDGDGDGPRHVFSVDYHPSSGGRVFYAGCRDGRICRADTRAPPRRGSGWDWLRHRSSVAHVRCLDDNQVLAAGPRSAMAIYDVRWGGRDGWGGGGGGGDQDDYNNNNNNNNNNDNQQRRRRQQQHDGGSSRHGHSHHHHRATSQPAVRFPGYRNSAHVRIGLDVTREAGGVGGLGCGGVVAAGLDDGTVGVFSLRTGRRLGAGDVDDGLGLGLGLVRAAGGGGAGGGRGGGVVKAVQFERMPWERETSLFVGVGHVVRKFSFGVDGDEEW